MSAFVDLAILGIVLAAARSGWRRGFVFFTIDLVGFLVAVVAAVRFHEVTAIPFELIGLSPTVAAIAGGLLIFIPAIVVVAIVGSRFSKAMFKPGLFTTNRVIGAASAGALGLALVLVGVLAARTASVPFLGDLVRRSPLATQIVEWSAPGITYVDDHLDLGLCSGRLTDAAPEACTPEPEDDSHESTIHSAR